MGKGKTLLLCNTLTHPLLRAHGLDSITYPIVDEGKRLRAGGIPPVAHLAEIEAVRQRESGEKGGSPYSGCSYPARTFSHTSAAWGCPDILHHRNVSHVDKPYMFLWLGSPKLGRPAAKTEYFKSELHANYTKSHEVNGHSLISSFFRYFNRDPLINYPFSWNQIRRTESFVPHEGVNMEGRSYCTQKTQNCVWLI